MARRSKPKAKKLRRPSGRPRGSAQQMGALGQKLGHLADRLVTGILIEDSQRRVVLMNASLRQMFGVTTAAMRQTTGQALARRFREVLKDPNAVMRRMTMLLREGIGASGEEVVLQDGRVLERDYAPFVIDGRSCCHFWSYRDVTARRRNEQRLAFALECTGQGVWDWDVRSGKVLYTQLGKPQSGNVIEYHQAMAADWGRQVHPEDVAVNQAEVAKALSGATDRFQMINRQQISANRGYRIVESQGKVVDYGPDGRPERLVGTFMDITDRVARERQLEAREATLKHAAHTAMLGELASNLAHELNQPLAALVSYSEAATRFLKSGARNDALASMQQTAALAEKASQIVSRLRRLVRRAAPVVERFDLLALARDATEFFQDEASKHRVQLVVKRSKRVIRLSGDRVQLEQFLVNLIRNAIESFPPNQPRPRRVKVSIENDGRTSVFIRVSDNGPGVPAEVASQIFEPFFTTKPTGTGLGLSISKSIIEAHGGDLWLDSTHKGGASFVAELPIQRHR